MKIKTNYGLKEINELFPDLESFKDYVLTTLKNIRYDNEIIRNKTQLLFSKLKEDEGEVSLSLMRGWLNKHYEFKIKKWGQLSYWVERGWLEKDALAELNKRGSEIKGRNRLCVEYWVSKGYSETEAIKKISEQQKKSAKCVKTYHGKSKKMLYEKGYTEDEVRRLCLTPSNIDFWINKGYSEDEAKIMVYENQKHAAKHVDYKTRLTEVNIEYWMKKGYSKQDAKKKVSERQSTFSLEICIKKYGEEKGKLRFVERQNKWQESLYKNGKLKSGFSETSQELFYKLIEHIDINDVSYIIFAKKGGELVLTDDNGFYRYDFADLKNNKIIEYNGDKYHANPKKYEHDDRPHPFNKNVTATELWDKDAHKKKIAEQNGFDVLTIWDSEYKSDNKQKIINKCINFLKNK
jgi:hypothetical protein